MATRTSTAAASTGPIRAIHAGVNSLTVTWSGAGTTNMDASATTVLMAKIPNGATIIDVVGSVVGPATCPFAIGINDPTDGGDTDADLFLTAGSVITVSRAYLNVPYDVSVSDDAAIQYQYVTVTPTPGTATSGVIIKLTCLYTMDR